MAKPGMNPHGCGRCTEVRTKCVIDKGKERCQRCSRLGYRCVLPPKTLSNSKARVARLQGQIRLLTQSEQNDPSGSVGDGNSSKEIYIDPPSIPVTKPSASVGDNNFSKSMHINPPNIPVTKPLLESIGGLFEFNTACDLLYKYITLKMQQFPFAVFPDTMFILTLQKENPFLLLAIMAASAEHDPPLQRKLDQEVKRQIGLRRIMSNERSMDFLQGLLVHIAWYHYHWDTAHMQVYLFLQIAISMAVDLGLDQSIGRAGASHSTTEKRALFGVFYLDSVLSPFRPQPLMKHTDWIDHCCVSLETNPEYPTDMLLRTYIEGQLFVQQCTEDMKSGDYSGLSRWMTLLEPELEAIQDSAHKPSQIGNWGYQLEINAKPVLILGRLLQNRKTPFSRDDVHQLTNLISSAEGSVAFFLKIPDRLVPHLALPFHVYLCFGLLVLSTALLLSDHRLFQPNFDRTHNLTIAIMGRLEKASVEGDLWGNNKRAMASILSWVRQRARPETKLCGESLAVQGSLQAVSSCVITSLGQIWVDPGSTPIFLPGGEFTSYKGAGDYCSADL